MPASDRILLVLPEKVGQAGDASLMAVSTEAMSAVLRYLKAYAEAADKRMHAEAKIGCEDIRRDIRYQMGAKETALDIANNLMQGLKIKGVTQ